ncbi:interferon-induced transmembrane protein 1-like isoform X2 [Tupaia chinensis]|uniref:interferon-induced transmembrane protein 1-like isoform X2 n=1 Tax=Tupaia chinensis TaxID=246437 RepID=UPI0007042A3B|nr:interferon-induced transmembrane protein 1-like isoform X2 [Tupaia chinensis]
MSHTSPAFTHTCFSQSQDMIKEEHEVSMLGPPQTSTAVTSTVVNIHNETTVPDHMVWSLFNTLFMNWFCLGFIAFAYSVKAGEAKTAAVLEKGREKPKACDQEDGPAG